MEKNETWFTFLVSFQCVLCDRNQGKDNGSTSAVSINWSCISTCWTAANELAGVYLEARLWMDQLIGDVDCIQDARNTVD